MSWSQLWVGIAATTVVGSMMATQVIPVVGSPVTLKELSYADGMITIERVIVTRDPFFFAQRRAYLVNEATNESLEQCEGTKNQRILPGAIKETQTLAAWTGNPACRPESIPPGIYSPIAVYIWGDHTYNFAGTSFTIEASP